MAASCYWLAAIYLLDGDWCIMARPLVAIVGRPNVGKSTFFNRVVGRQLAITEAEPGTTRDRLYAEAEWAGVTFTLVDTGGLETGATTDLVAKVCDQALQAVSEADLVLFMVDGKDGLVPADQEVAQVLRQTKKPVITVVNKADNPERRLQAVEFYRLGLGELEPISALQGIGVGDVLDVVIQQLPRPELEEETAALRLAIVGHPNVGKSSLLNALLGEERAIVSEAPGTTRDALDTLLDTPRGPAVIIDTAGIRRRGRVEPGVERYSVIRALRAVDRAEVVALVLDAQEGVTAQDTHIAGYIRDQGKGMILVVNKWDLVNKTAHASAEYEKLIRAEFNFVDYAPILFLSAKTGQRVNRLVPLAFEIRTEWTRRVPTGVLNQVLAEALEKHAPPSDRGKALRVYYVTQAGVEPPTFVFFVNDVSLVHFSYQRYLENQLRNAFGFRGTPLRLAFRPRRAAKALGRKVVQAP